jgi:hypothetical protein
MRMFRRSMIAALAVALWAPAITAPLGRASEAFTPASPKSCMVNDGEWFWQSDSLDITIGVRDDWVTYVAIALHHPGTCLGVGARSDRVVMRGWISMNCTWSDVVCLGDSVGMSAWVLFREPEDYLSQCSFTLRRTQPACEPCAPPREITLTRRTTAVESFPWSLVKRRFQ